MNIIVVDEVEIRAVASSEDLYGQGGFSAVYAKVLTSTEKDIAFLSSAHAQKNLVTIRCGRLEVHGKVTKCSKRTKEFEAVLDIEDLRLVKR
jgi:hypothetical protein